MVNKDVYINKLTPSWDYAMGQLMRKAQAITCEGGTHLPAGGTVNTALTSP